MSAGFSVHRFSDATRLEELHLLVHDAFRDLPINPPSSALTETLADFAARLQTDTIFVASAGGADRQHLLHPGRRRTLCRQARGAA